MSSYIARKVFQSTPSAWRETDSESTHENEEQNFNPLPPHGGRPQFYLSSFSRGEISIHSLRMEGDDIGRKRHTQDLKISIHSLRMEGDVAEVYFCLWLWYFNPLPPHGGRPGKTIHQSGHNAYFNPLPPHGGRHSLLNSSAGIWAFQSTPSAWRETKGEFGETRLDDISIHSLRMEGDSDRPCQPGFAL